VRVAAIRVLGQFGGPEVSPALLEVYSTGKMPVKRQVVVSLGERADTSSLFRIAQSENDDRLRDAAIVTLGKVGGREQLRLLFARASKETRLAVIRGLFLARDDDGLIRIAGQEKDPELRSEVLNRIRLIGTPKAKEYLQGLK
jgi:HEAT repeat protein